MSFDNRRRLLAFELSDYFYNYGDERFISSEWFQYSIENKYSRLVFVITSFLNGKNVEDDYLRDFHLEQNLNEIYEICKYDLFSFKNSDDKYLFDLFSKLKQFVNSLNSYPIGIYEFKSFIDFSSINKKYILYLIFWVAIKFFENAKVIENDLKFNQMVYSYLNLAYNIDHAIWDLIVSDYILSLRKKGIIEINSIPIELNDEIETLFFLLVGPYSICPALCSLLLLLKSEIVRSRFDSINYNAFVKSIINQIILLITNTLKEISPDMAELSFTITVCRMISNISYDLNNELIQQLFLLKHRQKTITANPKSINPLFLDRFILYSFISIEQLWLEITKDEQFFSSIINHIPTLEISTSTLSLMNPEKEFVKYTIILIILFSMNNQLSITGSVNRNTVEIMKKLVVISDEPIEIILKYFLFPNYTGTSKSESNIYIFFRLLSDNIYNISVSSNVVKSISNLIQINYFSLSDTFLYNYLESFPKLVKFCSINEETNRPNNEEKVNLLNCINSRGCILIDEMYWCNSNLIQLLLNEIDIKLEHILPFIYSISLSITSIQSVINNRISEKYGYSSKIKEVFSIQKNFKISKLNRSNINKSSNFLFKTKNIDIIIISILDYISDWIKKNDKCISFEWLLKHSKPFSQTNLDDENIQGYFSIFLIYFFSRTIEADKLDRKLITTNFHIVPWRSILRWVDSWEKLPFQSVLNPRTWKVIFSEIIAIMIPESLIIPSIPNSFTEIQPWYFSLNNVNLFKERINLWLKDRKSSLESLKNEVSLFDNAESTLKWLEMFYFEPNMAVYFTLEYIFIQESVYVKECHFQELYFELCSNEIKLKEFTSNPDIYIKKASNYLSEENSIEILCNISLIMLYFHEVIKHKNPIINHFQNADFEIFCIIWNKYANYSQIENQLTSKLLSMFFSNIFCRNTNIVQQIVEQGFQYKSLNNRVDFNVYLERTRSFIDRVCYNTPQILCEHTILPKIANKLDKLLNTRSLIDLWGKYNVTDTKMFSFDFQIENQIIQCVSLLSWLSNIIISPSKSTNYLSENSSSEKTAFLPVAERSVVRVLCITQDIINSQLGSHIYCNLIINFSILLKHSAHFIISVANSFPQLNKALKDTLAALKQLMNDHSLSNSSINHTINTIDEIIKQR
ncbi:uncharacterized protein cubi_00569 [Cryptosporidium ubiquitum]|uniref:Uncharacterized protein n=1 Tax=Cryptosporidium ubiquitum TaxID=857276 RepID=A0A1J4MC13_9CRYT|nr:uncharacterized protein cubi_00569 [Cryptosporidium ubiquitum]OII71762.1 hypothetical protein cubi_00569 [Cryptosporidium ubiquitum]